MKKFLLFPFLFAGMFISYIPKAFSQGFTDNQYKKALWMTTRMYGGQRSGENNWLVADHLPEGVDPALRGLCFIHDQDTDGYDLSGGWHDCGDHVKFGQTQFYAGYMLLKGYAEFPQGYDDYYSIDYKGYKASGDWSWEGGKGAPNGIPDILDEVKHGTDFFIKCARNANTFYYQVGQGGPDHQKWVTAVKMQTLPVAEGGEPRVVYKNPNGASMASFCGATLALMSRIYRKFDPAYADLCLQHALYAYAYAKAHPGTAATGDGGFYSANDNWKDDYASMCAELYWATGENTYKTEALSFSIAPAPGQGGDIYGKNYGFDYSNNGDIAIYNLALLGKPNAKSYLDQIVQNFYLGNVQADGQFAGGNTGWGPLRYNANTAFIVALWQKLYGTTSTPNQYIYDNIDYILGKNSANQSFVVGFGTNSPKHPHLRNIYLRDDNPGDAVKAILPIPAKNAQSGYMCGGTRNPASFNDNVVNYEHTEGGIDYNACLVGALAFINSVLAPVDTNKFGHPTPDLGSDRSICGVSSITLDTQLPTDGIKTFTWKKDAIIVSAASTSKNTFVVTQAGKYTCIVDSAGKWSTQASVTILGALPAVQLGADKELCDPASFTLDMGVTGAGISYTWEKDGIVIPNATSKTYTVYRPGTYRGTISVSGCPSSSDAVTISSKLLTVTDDTICAPGLVNLAVSGTGGPYKWYDAATAGNLLNTGNTFSTNITASKVLYVEDGSSLAAKAGPSSSAGLSNPSNGGNIGIRFTALRAFSITSVKVLPFVYDCNSDTVTVTFDLKQNGTTLDSYTAKGGLCSGIQSGAPFNTYYTLNFDIPVEVSAIGDYELIPSAGNALVWFSSGANFATMSVPDIITLTGDTRDDMENSYPAIFDISIQAGSGCVRTPVFAVIDPTDPSCSTVTSIFEEYNANMSFVYPNPSSSGFSLSVPFSGQVKIIDMMGRVVSLITVENNGSFGENLSPGIYHFVFMENNTIIKSINVVKN